MVHQSPPHAMSDLSYYPKQTFARGPVLAPSPIGTWAAIKSGIPKI